jgi:hypothetical protein
MPLAASVAAMTVTPIANFSALITSPRYSTAIFCAGILPFKVPKVTNKKLLLRFGSTLLHIRYLAIILSRAALNSAPGFHCGYAGDCAMT